MQASVQPPTQWTINTSQRLTSDPLLNSLVLLTQHFGDPCSAEALTAGLPVTASHLTPELLPQTASRAGLSTKLVRKGLNELPSMLLPCIMMFKDK